MAPDAGSPPSGWVRIADAPSSTEVRDGAAGDDDLVVWRTLSGTLCVMDARCPHQWSHLGAEGVVDGEEIICCSHWWRFAVDGTGTMLRTDGRREERRPIRVHAAVEHDGGVWIAPPG